MRELPAREDRDKRWGGYRAFRKSVIEESIGKKCVSQLAAHEVVRFVIRKIARCRRR